MISLVHKLSEPIQALAPSGGVVSGRPVMIGAALCLVPISTVAEGLPFAGYATGVFRFPKATGYASAAGALVEWDTGNNNVIANTGGTGDFDIGYVVEASVSADTTVLVAKVSATTTVH